MHTMNAQYRVSIKDPGSDRWYVVTVWAPNDAAAIDAARDWVDYRDRTNVSAGLTQVEHIGDRPEGADIVLKDE